MAKFTKSTNAVILERVLGMTVPGEVIPWDRLSDAIASDASRGRGYGALNTARRSLLSDRGIVFIVDRGVGLRHATDVDKVNESGERIAHIHRHSKRILRILMTVEESKISAEKRPELHALASLAGAVMVGTERRMVKALEAPAMKAHGILPIGTVLDVMRDRSGKKPE